MPEVELSAGTVEYEDRGAGPPVVLLNGVMMDSLQWRHVIDDLAADHRCIAPTLPLGAHRRPMRPDADLTLEGQVRLVSELLEQLELEDVTLAFNDWGGAQLLVAGGLAGRVARMVLVSCETADNYPPGLPGRNLELLGKLPGGLSVAVLALRLRPLRRLPMTFGWLSKRRVPHEVMDRWLGPATMPEVRRDIAKYVGDVAGGRRALQLAERSLSSFRGPVLVVWGAEDRIMPLASGRRLAEAFPDGRFVEVADSRTLVPLDQPARMAELIRELVREPAGARA